jgi:2-C-methyl-D-erythritol 2,4-cyclodiphosphate synthase
VSAFRVGLGYDVHPFTDDAVRALVLGGVTVDGGRGLAGYSDADVVAHAVADALLGPAGLADLGTLYPASDDRYRDASSLHLLRDVVERVREAGWSVVNVDVVIAAEEPVLAPRVEPMKENLVGVLGADAVVSIKPKHGEGVGAIGRAEGIAVWAVALLERTEARRTPTEPEGTQ